MAAAQRLARLKAFLREPATQGAVAVAVPLVALTYSEVSIHYKLRALWQQRKTAEEARKADMKIFEEVHETNMKVLEEVHTVNMKVFEEAQEANMNRLQTYIDGLFANTTSVSEGIDDRVDRKIAQHELCEKSDLMQVQAAVKAIGTSSPGAA